MEPVKKNLHIIIPLLVFILYLFTLAPGVIQIDSGELAAVQATLGIAHPTGYPLFTMLGFLFSLLPLPFSTIYQLNLLAALWCAAAIFVFIITARLILENPGLFQVKKTASTKAVSKKDKSKKANVPEARIEYPEIKIILSIVAGALILAFSKTFWFQSTSVEVYSLHIFLILLTIYLLLKAYLKEGEDLKSWLAFAAVLALGFTNHMTTLLILPGTAFLFFNKHKISAAAFKKIGMMLLIFFPLLILIYSYLPLRASQEPVINWGNPVDLEKILRHISGKQYQVWLFSSAEAAKKQLGYFFESLFLEFNISLFVCIAGIFISYFTARKISLFFLITFISTVLYSINYDIVDIDAYFLLAYISLAFFSVFGVLKLLSLLKFRKSAYSISSALIAVFLVLQFYFNIDNVNQSNTYTFEDYTKSLLGSTEKNSLIFSYQWDYFLSASYYFQFVEGYRRDIAVIDKELLRRSWYFKQIATAYPGVLSGIKFEQELFLNALQPFEKDEPFNSVLLEDLYQKIMTNIVATNFSKRLVYIGPELFENEMQSGQFKLPEGYTMVPDLFLFKVVKGNAYVPAADPDFTIRFPEKRNHYTTFIGYLTGSMLVRRALYELQFDKVDRAKVYIQKVKNDVPGYILPEGMIDVLEK